MLGPDHFEYGQTPDTKYCIVPPHAVPEYEYDHQKWENEFSLGADSLSPQKSSKTPEPPRKLQKLSSKPSVKRGLKLKLPKACLSDTSEIKKYVNLSSHNPIRVPRVPAWGGTFGNITLVNTCPIDNFLTIVYVRLKESPQLSKYLSKLSETWADDLLTIEQLFDKNDFTQGKIKWLTPFSHFDFSVAGGTFDVWGNEFDLFWKRFDSMLATAAKSTCSSEACPKKEDKCTVTGINLMEVAGQQTGETYIEAALREWLLPSPSQCGKQFKNPPPPTANATLGPRTLDLTSGETFQPHVCNGVRTYTPRKFCKEMPFALPIPLHHFASSGLITEPHHLPDVLSLQSQQYQLGGCTFWNGVHYNGCFRLKSQWFAYDGLPESRSRGSGILAVPFNSVRSSAFTLSSCVYFKVNLGRYTFFVKFIFCEQYPTLRLLPTAPKSQACFRSVWFLFYSIMSMINNFPTISIAIFGICFLITICKMTDIVHGSE